MASDLDLVCLGEPLLELNLQPSTEAGSRVYVEAHGGDASNVAVAAARQGAKVAFLSAIGTDLAGQSFLDLWRREKVDASAVRTDPDRHTGLYFVEHDAQGHHFSYLRRGSAASRYKFDETAREIVGRASHFFCSGISLGISEEGADSCFAAMSAARQAGRKVAFDTNYRQRLWPKDRAAAVIAKAIAKADVVFPGAEDADLLLGLTDPDAILDLCLSSGAGMAVLKMGSAGAKLATREGMRAFIEPFPCLPVDATGAGDTFCGSFLARLTAGDAPLEAGRYAACAAALATTGYGAVSPMPMRKDVLAAMRGD